MARAPYTGTTVMQWGEFRGRTMAELPLTYLDWLMRQSWIGDWPKIQAYCKSREAEIVAARPKTAKPSDLTTYDDYLKWGQ